MLTRKIDRALDAMAACKDRVPALREIYRADSPEGLALGNLMEAVEQAQQVLQGQAARAGE
ncbi:hypothetical protein ASD21_16935 [Caulobacter sp. Root1455]|jgi:hypothetical protein|uniref:hypothetical protein n=1 Tax=unclassified Caulobacter TaxID=2648921 RepID=UPI0006F238CF|nr:MULTISPECIES: hypothetical protein [unclassified Caulobacter]KQY26406.1 hypothetical protein ASD38_19340 [Caulobacter sp. Root487D2Y]KQY91385.1 hypothetical protein ASD21_16935 [Caulobacter sp. Root1455]